MSMTPEAAKKLVAFGVIPISDMATPTGNETDEIRVALLESTPVPNNDADY
jgi:hypothetical protein